MGLKKTVRYLNNRELKDWADNHQWKWEREEGRREIKRRLRKNKNAKKI